MWEKITYNTVPGNTFLPVYRKNQSEQVVDGIVIPQVTA